MAGDNSSMRPSRTPISSTRWPSGVSTRPPRMIRSNRSMILTAAIGGVRPWRNQQRNVIVASRVFNFERNGNDIQESLRAVVALGAEIISDAELELIISRDKLVRRKQRRIQPAIAVGNARMEKFAVAIDRNLHPRRRNAARSIQNMGRQFSRHNIDHFRVTIPVMTPNGSSTGTNISLSFLIPKGSR